MSRAAWALWISVHLLAAAFMAAPSVLSVDEVAYLHQAAAFSEGRLDVGYGTEVRPSVEEEIQVARTTVLREGRIWSKYPPLGPLLAAPLHPWLGFGALVVVNAVAFVALAMGTARLAGWVGGSAPIAVVVLSASWAWSYAAAGWPHALAAALQLWAVLHALDPRSPRAPLFAGLLAGAAFATRLDAALTLLPIGVLLLWRAPRTLIPFFVGLVPGVLLLSVVNVVRFETPNPFTYGNDADARTAARFLPFAAVGLGLVVAALLARDAGRRPRVLQAVIGLGLVAAVFRLDLTWKVVTGAWALLVDMRGLSRGPEVAMVRGEDGAVIYAGAAKLALFQGAPLMVLGLFAPLVAPANRGRQALTLLVPVLLAVAFGRAAWHGGLCFNQRYLLPALPFLAATTSIVLAAWSSRGGRIAAVFGGAAGVAAWFAGVGAPTDLAAPALHTVPLLLCGGLALAVLAVRLRPSAAPIGALVAGAAFTWGLEVLGRDLQAERRIRVGNAVTEARAEALVTPGALFVVSMPDPFAGLGPDKRVTVAVAAQDRFADAPAFIGAFLDAGRGAFAAMPERFWARSDLDRLLGAGLRITRVGTLPHGGLVLASAGPSTPELVVVRIERSTP